MKHYILIATCATILVAASGAAQAASISDQGTWKSTLQKRDLDGNQATVEAYYDTTLNITWLADANYANNTNNNRMVWSTANDWAATLNPYGSGITGWRLPTVTDTGTPGCNWALTGTDCGYNVDTATSEMAHMFYTTLGNKGYYAASGGGPQSGWGLTNTGPFSKLQARDYWSSSEGYGNYQAWFFDFYRGYQDHHWDTYGGYAWPVHAGDVGAPAIPVPAAAWLFGSGLLGLVGLSRKRRR